MNYQATPIAGLLMYLEETCGQKSSFSCNSSIKILILPNLGPMDRAERSINSHLLFKSWFITACQCVTKIKIDL